LQEPFGGGVAFSLLDESDEEESEDEDNVIDFDDGEARGAVTVCASLAQLQQLRALCIDSWQLVPGDAFALTELTGLESLQLVKLGAGVGDLAANALACSLKQLRSLTLQDCDLGSMVCTAAIAHLTQLTQLRVDSVAGLTQQQLLMLTRLSCLVQLDVDGRELTKEVVDQFWALLHRRSG
jgi:hypothetical protein